MARAKKDTATETTTETETETATETAPATASSGQGRAIILPGGERRIDYIKRRYCEDKASRSTIAKELTELQGKPVPYQIVFQATKGLEGGPAPAPAAEAASTDSDAA